MKTLVVEDDYISAHVMTEIMLNYGEADCADDGKKAIDYFEKALSSGTPYELVLLDIMMPEMDGQEALESLRDIEVSHKIFGLDSAKIVMTTALDDFENIKRAFRNQCDGYLVKPIDRVKLDRLLKDFRFI